MSQYNDEKSNRLELSGYIDGSLSDRWSEYLKVSTGWLPGDPAQLNDLVGIWLEQQGAIGSTINDKWHDLLGQLGFDLSDQLQDRLYDFWSTEAPLP